MNQFEWIYEHYRFVEIFWCMWVWSFSFFLSSCLVRHYSGSFNSDYRSKEVFPRETETLFASYWQICKKKLHCKNMENLSRTLMLRYFRIVFVKYMLKRVQKTCLHITYTKIVFNINFDFVCWICVHTLSLSVRHTCYHVICMHGTSVDIIIISLTDLNI